MSATPEHPQGQDSGPPEHDELREGQIWDRRFAEQLWSSDPDAALVELVAPLVPGTALDLGCGPGRNAVWLAKKGWTVTGVDASEVGLAQACERASRAGVEIETMQADILSFEPSRGFDLVLLANIHLREPERSRAIKIAARALEPGGHLFVIGHHLDDLGRAGPPDAERLYTEQRMRYAFSCVSELLVERLERRRRDSSEQAPSLSDVLVWARRVGGTPARGEVPGDA